MSDTHPPDSELPEASVTPVKSIGRRFSLVWLVPIVAALIGGWLVVKALTEKGPEITITFKSAEGLEAGKTKVRFKDVEIGQVSEIGLGRDLSHVVVKAQLARDAERFLSEHTRFWVVRARVSASAIYGLGTVFSGAYIDLDPGQPGPPAVSFTGLEEPPIVTTGLPGGHFILESERRESLEVGAPVYYRQLRAGEVVAYNLSDDGTKILAKIFIHAPYHRFVTENSRFWNASGINLTMDATGIQVYTESLVSIVVGGIAFDSFPSNSSPGSQAQEDAIFRLYSNRQAALEKIYATKNYFVLLFEESVRGLSPGAPVEFRGIPIGQVIEIRSEFDFKRSKVKIPVIIATEPERISLGSKLPDGVTEDSLIDHFVEKGFRAQLRTGNILTGQLFIAVDFFPDAKPARVVSNGKYGLPEFPTTPTQLAEIGSKLTHLVAKIDTVPIEQIGNDLRDTMKGAKRLATSPELQETVTSLNAAVKEIQGLTAELRTETAPELAAALKEVQALLSATSGTLQSDSPLHVRLQAALEELSAAARSLRLMADYLERHPEAILRGKEPTP
jgi:paraquat-inducible protein B